MKSTLSNIEELVKVNNVVGEPILTPDGITLIPISKVSFAFGGGGGDARNGSRDNVNAGSAAGVKIDPVGFLVIKDGVVRMVNVQPPAKTSVDRALDLVPQVLDRVDMLIDKKM
ncbi:MAG: sporulation protein YtfJ [Oscillospiraceae bacterium]|nr:sporulation protein YtfJ [Oscillospiraceae bacterium]